MDLSPRQTLDELAKDLANREGDLDANEDYELPSLDPLSHDHVLLSSATPDFDVEAFLLSRSHTSLSDLRVELRDYLSQLKEELVQLINDDYEAFISLSTDLRGEGARLERIHAPVEGLRQEIQKSSSMLLEVEAAVQVKLAERTKLREEKTLLRLLFSISDSLNRLESLLLIPSPDGAQQDAANRKPHMAEEEYDQRTRAGRAKHLSRVGSEYVQLLYQAEKARAEDCVFVSENQWRIDRIKETLCRDLDQLFGNALQSFMNGSENSVQERARLVSDLSECFKTYDSLDIHEEAEEIIRIKVVQPFVKRTIFTGALSVPHSPIVPRTPFIPSSGAGRSVPATPFTPFTAHPNRGRSEPQSYFFLSDENNRLPLLDDTESQLATLYNTILQFVEKNCLEIMEIASRVIRKHGKKAIVPSGSSPTPTRGSQIIEANGTGGAFDIMANVIWADVGRALMDELGALIFAAGKPVEFKANYTTSKSFLSALEYLAPDSQAVQAMRDHPVYAAFERRWQLPVYFQLRWKEIVGDLEISLTENRLRPSFDQDASGSSYQASAVVSAISRCWDKDVFIPELGHRFWKLTLQIVERYKHWLRESMPVLDATQAISNLRDEKSGITRTATPPPRAMNQQAESNEASSTSDEEKLRQLASMISDVKIVRQQVMLLWHEEISPCAGVSEDVPLEDILHDSLAQLDAIIPNIISQLVAILTRRCCEPVEKVRQVPAQVRSLSRRRDLPNTPSQFVADIFKPLRDFFGISGAATVVIGGPGAPPMPSFRGAGKGLRDEYSQKWATDILEVVSSHYKTHLEDMKKNEEALRRLRKGARSSGFSLFGSSASAGQDDASKDEERVRAQRILDVQRLGQDAETFGVDLKSSPTYGTLMRLAEQSDDV